MLSLNIFFATHKINTPPYILESLIILENIDRSRRIVLTYLILLDINTIIYFQESEDDKWIIQNI